MFNELENRALRDFYGFPSSIFVCFPEAFPPPPKLNTGFVPSFISFDGFFFFFCIFHGKKKIQTKDYKREMQRRNWTRERERERREREKSGVMRRERRGEEEKGFKEGRGRRKRKSTKRRLISFDSDTTKHWKRRELNYYGRSNWRVRLNYWLDGYRVIYFLPSKQPPFFLFFLN